MFYRYMDTRQSIVADEVLKLARQVAEDQSIEVLEVTLSGRGKGTLMRVTIDRSGGVTLDDCERFSRRLGLLLEAEDSLQGSYNLEVSSPGLDRPLTALKDFERNKGKLVRIITKDKIDNQNFFLGRIIGITADIIQLDINGKERNIPFDNISRARLEIEIK
ncbi:MAG: ribosome maturation factor RimP [Thermodesulfovibrionales bacterium]|nr:ribosome maturation factor RimP [Thermodesulfovibrionales bacterium]